MRFTSNTYRSLTESINSVQNEDIQTPERAAEMKRKIKRLKGRLNTATKKYQKAHSDAYNAKIKYPSGLSSEIGRTQREKSEASGREMEAGYRLGSAQSTDEREKSSQTTLYGKRGKVLATRKAVTTYSDWKPTETKTKKKVQTEGIKHILRAKHAGKLSAEKAQTFKNKVARRLSKMQDDGTPTTALRKGAVKAQGAVVEASSPAWQRKAGKDPEGGLNAAGVASYRRANPGSKLQTAVTEKPSKLKAGSKKWKRRKSFCSRMKGMKSKLTSSETARDPDSRINKSLRKWNC